jgi:hypothetical protein
MYGVLPVKGTILFQLQFFLGVPPVLFGGIVFPFAFGTLKRNQLNRCFFARHLLNLLFIKGGVF